MGIAAGAGLLLGVLVAVNDATALLVTSILCLGLLCVIVSYQPRVVLLCLGFGLLAGWALTGVRATEVSARSTVYPVLPQEAIVITDPRVTPQGASIRVHWLHPDSPSEASLVLVPPGSQLGRGDTIRVHGDVGLGSEEAVVFASSAPVVRPAGWLDAQRRAIRGHATEAMITYVPGSAGSITLGLLIGDDTRLSASERSALRASGLTHITAVSGWNVSVIIASVGAVFQALGRRGWFWLGVQLTFLAGYVWIVGLEPPIERAAIMGAAALVGIHFGRPAHGLTLLTITAGLMAVWDPTVVGSLSFLLSFLSMLGLMAAARMTASLRGWKLLIASPTVTASAAGLATAPLLAATFGTVSLSTVPANVLAGALVSLATFAGIAVVLVSWIWPLAEVAGWVTWIISSTILGISGFFGGIPGGQLRFAPLRAETILVIYAWLAFLALPVVPEGRQVCRRLEQWGRDSPPLAGVSIACVLLVLGAGVVSLR